MRIFVTGGLILEEFEGLEGKGDAGVAELIVKGRLRSDERFLSSIVVGKKLLRRPTEVFGEEPAE